MERSTLGAFSESVEICVLHIFLIVWFHWLCDVLHNLVIPFAGERCRKVAELPDNHPLSRFLNVLSSWRLNKLKRKIIKVWEETDRTAEPKLKCKFRGEEVSCSHFLL